MFAHIGPGITNIYGPRRRRDHAQVVATALYFIKNGNAFFRLQDDIAGSQVGELWKGNADVSDMVCVDSADSRKESGYALNATGVRKTEAIFRVEY